MKRKYIVSISIIILTLSMIAIFFLELLQIRSLYQASNDTIERSINEAISQTVIQLQKQDVAIYVYDKVVQAEQQNPSGTNEGHNFNSYIGGKSNISKATELNMNFNNNDIEAIELYYMEQFGDPKSEFSKLALQLEAEYTQRKIPIEKRFNSELIGKILTQNLKKNGLELEIEFAIIDEISQKVKISSDDFRVDTYDECYRYNIINGSLTDNPHILAVYTPSKVDV
ncbi:MAG: hypothetical protein HUK15_04550, partial [Bacteroidales bacterium]|nr:hypothetical protein [Bacteroidales bacterium]